MADINSIVIAGRLTADVTRKDFAESTKYSFSIAVGKRVKKDGTWQTETNYFDVETWNIGKLADTLTKGRPVVVRGSLDVSKWMDNGIEKKRIFIRADEVQPFHKGDSSQKTEEPKPTPAPAPKKEEPKSDWDDLSDIPF